MRSRACGPGRAIGLLALLLLMFCSIAQAQEIEGTWKLVTRKLQDGTAQTPPIAQGAATWHNGVRTLIVYGHTPEGKPWCLSLISSYKISGTEWTETLLLSVYDDGSGKAPAFNQTTETKTTPVTRDGPRIAFKPVFEPVSYVFEGDKWTATLEGVFVDYWERVR